MTSDTPSSEELLKAFPEWTPREEDSWLELFKEYSLLLMGARLDPEDDTPRAEYQERLDAFKEDLLMAAELADGAIEETLRRFEIQKQQKEKQRTRAKSTYQARRAGRVGNRK